MKSVSTALLNHLRSSATTTCGLIEIGPLPNGEYLRMTSLDRDVIYEGATYYARTGFDAAATVSTSDLGIDNSEIATLEPEYPNTAGITVEMIDRGDLDAVEYRQYWVDYENLDAGSVLWSAGLIGEQYITKDNLVRLELRSWSQLMKQRSVVQLYSKTCRADFGSGYPGSGALREERFPCNYDLTGEWVSATVTSVGNEVVREFTIVDMDTYPIIPIDAYYAPGLVQWTSGDNIGQSQEIESFTVDTGYDVTLLMTTRNPVQVGDTLRMRRGCTKLWSGHNSCETYENQEWFRAEKDIPVGDGITLNVPGVAGGGGFIGGAATDSPE